MNQFIDTICKWVENGGGERMDRHLDSDDKRSVCRNWKWKEINIVFSWIKDQCLHFFLFFFFRFSFEIKLEEKIYAETKTKENEFDQIFFIRSNWKSEGSPNLLVEIWKRKSVQLIADLILIPSNPLASNLKRWYLLSV